MVNKYTHKVQEEIERLEQYIENLQYPDLILKGVVDGVNSAFKTSGLAASTSEQNLYANLIREAIQIHGTTM